jgi:predicted secreted protein
MSFLLFAVIMAINSMIAEIHTLNTKVDEIFKIRLPSNPSTRYTWQIRPSSGLSNSDCMWNIVF